MKHFLLHKDDAIRRANCIAFIDALPNSHVWSIEIKQYRKKRSIDQNAYLHGVPLKMICDHTGYDVDDMKTYLLGGYSGWEEYEMFGERRKRPVKRSSDLNTLEFTEFIEFIQRWASENLEMYIPNPNEEIHNA